MWGKWMGMFALAACLTGCATDRKTGNADQPELVGAYTDHREMEKEELKLFQDTYKMMPRLTPQKVSTQVVAGMNYSFICVDNLQNIYKVVIYKPLPGQGEPRVTGMEPVTAYQEIIEFVKQGFLEGWENSSPEDRGLSQVFSYEAPTSGYALMDINHDGVTELLLGDTMDEEGNDYAVYDIFTFDTQDGTINHVLSGGERDRFHFNGQGIIIEEGSSGADNSFTKYFQLENAQLRKLPGDTVITEDLMLVKVTPFLKK